MDYPDDDMLALFNKVCAKKIFAQSNLTHENQDLELGASGNIQLNTDTIELNGDTIFNSNIAVNSSLFVGDMNVFRTFDDGHTITYGLRISDDEKLQIYKNDTTQNKSVVVFEIGGKIGNTNTSLNEEASGKLNGLYNKAKGINRRVG